jgi:hypothetical protein
VVDYEMPNQVGHDGQERALYAWLLNAGVPARALSGFNKLQPAPSVIYSVRPPVFQKPSRLTKSPQS